jgi:glucosamine-6-phosphate deaminase
VEVVISDSVADGASLVADAIDTLVRHKPTAVLGLATGSTPLPVYDALVEKHRAGLSFASVRGFALDEYVGLPADHPESYRSVLHRELTSRVDFAPGSVSTPDGWAKDIPTACLAYEESIRTTGGIDLQLLGVGTDGHIGFNEPTSSLGSLTRVKTLTEQTRRDNARFFGNDLQAVPRHVITAGVATILRARHLVLLAWGESKAEAVAATVEGPVTSMVPSSALQLHPHTTVVLDHAAASKLRLTDYYRAVYAAKPHWQGI